MESPRVNLCRQELLRFDIEVKSGANRLESEWSGSMAELTRFSQDLREKCGRIEEKIANLEDLAREQKSPDVTKALLKESEGHRVELRGNLNRLRNATLSAVRRLEGQNRSDLLGPSGTVRLRNSTASAQAQMLGKSAEVTNSLGSLLAQMGSQLHQSEANLAVLLSSSEAISATGTEFQNQSAQVQTANKLLSKYGRREVTGKVLFALAFLLYFATLAYIMRKRI